MASLLRTMYRLRAAVGTRGRRSQANQSGSARKLFSTRLSRLEALEERALLSVVPLLDDHGLVSPNSAAQAAPAPSRVIVRFDDAVPLSSAKDITANLGGTVLQELPSIHGVVIQLDTAGQDPQEAMSAAAALWSAQPGVQYAEADGLMHFEATMPNDEFFSYQWALDNTGQLGGVVDADIDAPEAWDIFRGSKDVVVADIDSGADYTHEDLAANMWVNPGEIPGNGIDDDGNGWVDDVYGVDTANRDGDPQDDVGHGTHTAGTIGAVGNNDIGVAGVNWNVQIMAVKIGGLYGIYISDAVMGIDYMTMMKTQHGINIVASNNSWGGYGYDQSLYDAIQASNDAGILFVAAAGNYASNNDAYPFYPASYDLPGIISVAATDQYDDMAYFSNYGRTSVDLGAPGDMIASTYPGNMYAFMSGTSMAAPHVTGAIALAMGLSTPSTDYVKDALLSSVDPLSDLANTTVSGGRLNLCQFLVKFLNNAPVLDNSHSMSLRPVVVGEGTNFGARVSGILVSAGTNPISDPDDNALAGIAVTAANNSFGSWQYSVDNGVHWFGMGSPSSSAARLLAADAATRIRFVPNPGYHGKVAPGITFRAWDQTSGHNGGTAKIKTTGGRSAFSLAIASASVTVTLANSAPVLDASVALSLTSIAEDADDSSNPGTLIDTLLKPGNEYVLTDVDNDPLGIAVIAADSTNGSWEYKLLGSAVWESMDSATTSQAILLTADDRIRFVPDADFNGTVDPGIHFRAWDRTKFESGDVVDASLPAEGNPFSPAVASASITVLPVNDAPELNASSFSLAAIREDIEDDANVGARIKTVLGTPSGIRDVDAGALQGIAVIAADNSVGQWVYSLDSGFVWQPIETNDDSEALLLASDGSTRIRFVPKANFNGPVDDGITFVAWDRTIGENGQVIDIPGYGGTTTFSVNSATIGIRVTPVNDAPTFAMGSHQELLEDAIPPEQEVPGWVTEFHPGPDDESGQAVDFRVQSDHPELFSALPAIDDGGTLTYTPAPDAFGTATVFVWAHDDGGTANGGRNLSDPQAFTITILPVNDPPSFDAGADVTVNEDAGPQALTSWATNVDAGAENESGQRLTFVIADCSDSTLFSQQPAIGGNGTLTFTPAPNANGSADVTVYLQDDGGTANGGWDRSDPQTFTITILPVNDAPSFVPGSNVTVDEDAGPQTLPWATNLSPGPDDESGQDLTFVVSDCSNSDLFWETPWIMSNGSLAFTPAEDANGSAQVTVYLSDDGGTDNGGVDQSASHTFTITILPVNDPPSFDVGPDVTVNEDAGPQTVTYWATNISPGPDDENGQDLTFVVADCTDPALFSEQPAIRRNGTLTFTPAPNANGFALVTVCLKDDGGTDRGGSDVSDEQTFMITVDPVNDAPSAFGAQITLDENQSYSLASLCSDGDADVDQQLTFNVVSGHGPAHGTLDAAGVYQPNSGYWGPDTFKYTVTDDDQAGPSEYLTSAAATVTVVVSPVVDVSANSNLLLRKSGSDLQLQTLSNTGKVIGKQTFAGIFSKADKLTIQAADDAAVTLTVDFSVGGIFTLPDGVAFIGGSAPGGDTLAVRATDKADTLAVESGRVVADGLSIAFENTEKLTLDGRAGDDVYQLANLEIPVGIADKSGKDLLDFSRFQGVKGVFVDLNLAKGQAQHASDDKSTLWWLSGVFENVIGSDYDDSIAGNSAANVLRGGKGNDALRGGGGNDILFGEEGDDVLLADPGKSILIGGAGKDVFNGSQGENILIGGTTDYDNNNVALMAVLREWISSRSFNTRKTRLQNGVGTNPTVSLKLGTTVHDDGIADTFLGNRAKNWLLGPEA